MNTREIWTEWLVHRQNTAEIAKHLKLKECIVESVISRCLSARYDEQPMPFDKESA